MYMDDNMREGVVGQQTNSSNSYISVGEHVGGEVVSASKHNFTGNQWLKVKRVAPDLECQVRVSL